MKCIFYALFLSRFLSHPSRGAWIEISTLSEVCMALYVAPLTGCVD